MKAASIELKKIGLTVSTQSSKFYSVQISIRDNIQKIGQQVIKSWKFESSVKV